MEPSADPKELFGQRVQEHDLCGIVGHDDGIADVLDDQIEAVAFLANDLFGKAQFVEIGAHFHIGAAQIGDVAHHRNHAGARAVGTLRGRADGLEEDLFALHHIHQREVSRGILAADHHGGERGGEEQIIELHGTASAIANALGDAKKSFGSTILNHHAVLIVGKNDRIGHALHDRAQARDGDFHIAHAIEVVLDLEEAGQIAIGAFGEIAELLQAGRTGVFAELGEEQGRIGPHAAGAADLSLKRQAAGETRILNGEAILAAFAFGFPAARIGCGRSWDRRRKMGLCRRGSAEFRGSSAAGQP